MRRIALVLALLAAAPLRAQVPAAADSAALRPHAEAAYVLAAAPVVGGMQVDGRLDEAAWATASPATGFTQAYPNPGAPASERTEVRILVAPDALYVGARMYDSRPDSIAAQLSRRDVLDSYSDAVSIFLDTHHDRRTGFHFGVNPRGVKYDSYYSDDSREDTSWDAVWDVATRVDSLGWTAEFRIPFSQLRFPPRVSGGRVWGLGVMRDVARRDERSTWSPWTRNTPGFVSTFGELHGLGSVRAPTRLEIQPYTSARLVRAPGDGDDPFYSENDVRGSVGADVRYGLPGGLTLTATLNPDFGQVEVDPAVVNLSAFEVFYPERRPFFVEGSDVFRFGNLVASNFFGNPQLFYSRRVGRPPQLGIRGADIAYVDLPEQSTILGAVKVSGKTAGGWTVGVLEAVTDREEGRFRTELGEGGLSPVEPLSSYFVGRVRRDLNRGKTVLGGMVTATNRDMSDSIFGPSLRSAGYVAGIDGQHAWKNREWTLSGYLAGSAVRGSEEAIANTQLSSARYFARPDADHLRYDPDRRSLGGRAAALALQHSGRWDGSLAYQEVSPGFEINELGFQGTADRRYFSTYLGRRVNRPKGPFRSHSYSVYTSHYWNFGGDNLYADYTASANGTLKSFWSGGVSFTYSPDLLSDRLTRGGPLALLPAAWQVAGNLATDRRKRVWASGSVSHTEDWAGNVVRSILGSVTLRPSTSLQVSVGPRFSRVINEAQYVTARTDSLATATFGRRYVFADVDQSTFSLSTRVSWTFTPNLSLELFAQPFVSSGDFENYKEFAEPESFKFRVYGRDVGTVTPAENGFVIDPDGDGSAASFPVGNRSGQRDFTVRSLRGNAVLRWEYRPGSTLFFVWQQLRSAEYGRGDLDFGTDFAGIFGEPARNVFMVKATYWLSR